MTINPYLNFLGNCEEAFTLYADVLGGKIVGIHRFGQMPAEFQCPGASADMVMHARLEFPGGVLMGADCPPQMYSKPAGYAVSLNVAEPADAERAYAALSEGGEIDMPIQETFWARRFAMFTDRFGTRWMINCEKPM